MIKNESSINKKAAVIIAAAAVVLLFAGIFCGAAAAATEVTITFYDADGTTVVGEPQIVSGIPQDGSAKVELLKKEPFTEKGRKYFIGWEDCNQNKKYYTDRQALRLTKDSPATLNLKAVFVSGKTMIKEDFWESDINITSSGYYVLDGDVDNTLNIKPGVLAVLDLNGNDLWRSTWGTGYSVLNVQGTLFIRDSSTDLKGTIKGGHSDDYGEGGGITVHNGGILTIENAKINDNDAKHDGGGIHVAGGGEVTMLHAFVGLNKDYYNDADRGGGIYVQKNGVFTMVDGDVRYNSGYNEKNDSGAGVYVEGTFYMLGGYIRANAVSQLHYSYEKGAGVYVANGGNFVMSGGYISENGDTYDGKAGSGVYIASGGTFTGTGGAVHYNKGGAGVMGTGIYCEFGGKLHVSGAFYVNNNAIEDIRFCGTNSLFLTAPFTGELRISDAPAELGRAAGTYIPTAADLSHITCSSGVVGIDAIYNYYGSLDHCDLKKGTAHKVTFNWPYLRTPADQTVIDGGRAAKPADPAGDETHAFAGWFKDAECTVPFDFSDVVISRDTIIYGKAAPDLIEYNDKRYNTEMIVTGDSPFAGCEYSTSSNVLKLTKDISLTEAVKIVAPSAMRPNNFVIDLNGHTIRNTADGPDSVVINVTDGSALDIIDTSTNQEGKITGANKSGVYVASNAQVTMSGGSIAGNHGSGVFIDSRGTFTIQGGVITDNNATNGGGVYVNADGSLIVDCGEISGNHAGGSGGGIYSIGVVHIIDGKISNNTADTGGGIYIGGGSLTLDNTGGINANTAGIGGGVYVAEKGIFTMNKGTISSNTATTGTLDDDGGAGVYVAKGAAFTLVDGSISGNISESFGGGVQCNGVFEMKGGKISDNSAVFGGGGVYVEESDVNGFIFSSGSISGNTVTYQDGAGGGICVDNGGKAVMRASSGAIPYVEKGNKANYGAGVAVIGKNSVFTLESGIIGGGKFPQNEAQYGGGFYVYDGGTFEMTGGYVVENVAKYEGGAGIVYDGGTLILTGGLVDMNYIFPEGSPISSDIAVNHEKENVYFEMSGGSKVNHLYLADGSTPITIKGKLTGYAHGIRLKDGSITHTLVAVCDNEDAAKENFGKLLLDPAKYPSEEYTLALSKETIFLQQKKCTVTFINEGKQYDTKTVDYNTPVEKPADPSSPGREFSCWVTSEGAEWFFKNPIRYDMTLYAHYGGEPTTKITFNPNGGEFVKDHQSAAKTVSCIAGSEFGPYFTDLEVSRPGYKFIGWYDAESGGTKIQPTDLVPTYSRTLYAHWDPIRYTIAFDGGEGASGTTTWLYPEYDQEVPLSKNGFKKEGYDFVGWQVPGIIGLKKPGDKVKNLTTKEYDRVTVTAVWKKDAHTVTFWSGTAKYFSMPAKAGSLITKPADPQKTHYTFAGWYKEPEFTTPWDFTSDRMPDNDLSLYAKWTENPKYTVTYDVNGGSGTPPVPGEYYAGTKVTVKDKTASMEKSGYYFSGWMTNAAGGGTEYKPGGTFTITGNTTLYAEWVKKSEYDVDVLTDGHGTASAAPGHAAAGTTVRLSYTAAEGYKFDHWDVLEGGVTISGNTFTMPSRNVTIKAYFVPKTPVEHKITLEVAGHGHVTADPTSAKAGVTVRLTGSADPGYVMTDWRIYPEDLEIKEETPTTMTFVMPDDDVYLYAFFGPEEKYTVTYYGNGATSGDVPIDSTKYDAGNVVRVLGNPGSLARDGYTFSGWNTNASGTGTEYKPGDIFTITSNTTLYAEWVKETGDLIKYDGKIYNENTIVMDGSPFAGCEYSPDSRILKITKAEIPLTEAVEIIAPGGLDPVFTIDLNGNAIKSDAVHDSVIKVTAGSALNITDSHPTSKQLFKKLPSGALEWLGPDAMSGDVLLKGGIITGGTKSGVYVDSGAQVTMFAGSIAGNKGDDLRGGGVYVGEKGSFILKGGAAVTGNESSSGGGVYVDSVLESGTLIPGSLTVEGGEISNNVATSNDGGGGGIFSHGGEVCIDGGAVSGNSAKYGGGITITRGNTLILKGGVISGNSAEYNGGGVYMWSTTDKFTMTGGKISANTALTGGGVYNMGSFVMEGGEISNNTANSASSNDNGGAGVYVAAYSTFTLKNGLISTNVSNSFGGGVQCNGSFVMWGGKISDNRAALGGGGVYVEESDADNKGFTFNAGRILRNVVSSATDEVGSGGGICVYNGGKAVMRETTYDAPKIAGNKANYGGGVFVAGQNSVFTLESGWFGDPGLPNHAGYGGGFYVQEGGRFTMTGGYVYGNWAGQKGGAGVVYAGGTVSISGGAVLETDKAGLLTSGISVASDGQKSARLEISDKANVFQVCLADETPIYITGKFADGDRYGVSNIVFNGGSVTGAVAAECADEAIAQSSLSHLKLNAAKHSGSTLIVEGKKITLQRMVCTVKFVNEGSIWKTERVYCNTQVTKPDDPHSTIGLPFLGWFTSADSAWVFTTPVTSDMTLYAHYGEQPTVKIAFNPNGGIFVKGHQSAAKTVYCIIGSKFEPYFNDLEVSFTGHKLTGWFTEPEGGRQVPYDEIITTSSPRTLYAHWTPIIYKIEYNPGEGSGEKYDQGCIYGVEAALLENRFTPKSGYTFAGWDVPGVMEPKQPEDRVINLTTKDGDTVPVTAVWKANMHTVTFYSDGAEPFSMPAETGSFIPKPDDPEKPDYTFAGWYKEPEFTTPWNFDTDRMPDNDLNLYAKWTENPKYTVTYDVNGGSGTAPDDPTEYHAGSQVTVKDKTPDMKRVGYTFNGWSGKPDGTGISYMPGHTFTITGSTILYAKWVKETEYNVSISDDGHGTASAAPSHAVAGATIRLSYTPNTGYEFDHWESSDVTVGPDNTFTMPAKNVTVKAFFREVPKVMYTVTYNVNGGSGTPPTGGEYEAGADVLVKDKTSEMKKDGYYFGSWNSKPDGTGTTYRPGSTFEITGNITLYAEWIKESVYDISVLNDGHGTGSSDPGSAAAGTLIRLKSSPYDDYKFDHWESTDVTVGPDNTFVMPAKNVTVKACFTKAKYTVTYNVNGGSGTPPAGGEYEAGSLVTVKDKTSDMKKDGYYFGGWNSKPDGTGTTYQPGTTFKLTGNITLYAEWVEESVYNISVLNDGHGTGSSDHGSAAAGTTVRLFNTPDAGYEFDHWESADVIVSADNTFVMPPKNVTVTAHFKELPKVMYTVTYNVNGGSGTPPAGGEYEAGSPVTVKDKTSDMKKDGYYFGGWNSKPDGTGTTYQPGTTFKLTGNITLYAEWVEESVYDISVLNDGHGTGSSDHGSAAAGATIRLFNTPDAGYEFDRWESADVTVGPDNTFVMPAKNVTVTAHFKELPKVMYTVIYDGNEATSGSAPDPATYETGTPVTVQGNTGGLARDGYTFSGWNTDRAGTGTDYQPGSTFVITGNITLYAEWTPVEKHSITIDIIGPGHATSDKPFAEKGETVHLYGSADPGYAMTDWRVYPSDLVIWEESETSLYFTMPDEDVYLYGFFGPAPGPTPTPTPKPTPHQGGSQGSSVWLTETPTPTPTPTGLPTPTAVPLATPTETPKSPVGIVGILAGLGAAAVLLRRK